MSRSLAGSVINIEASAVSGIDLGRRPEAVIPDAAESVTRIGMKIDGTTAATTATGREQLSLALRP